MIRKSAFFTALFSLLLLCSISGLYQVNALQSGSLSTGGVSLGSNSVNITKNSFGYQHYVDDYAFTDDYEVFEHMYSYELDIKLTENTTLSIITYLELDNQLTPLDSSSTGWGPVNIETEPLWDTESYVNKTFNVIEFSVEREESNPDPNYLSVFLSVSFGTSHRAETAKFIVELVLEHLGEVNSSEVASGTHNITYLEDINRSLSYDWFFLLPMVLLPVLYRMTRKSRM